MTKAQVIFNKIAAKLSSSERLITVGKMMSSPAIKYNNKVFCFFNNNQMTFRLGNDFNPKSHKIKKWSYLSPFKTKPPMKSWFNIPFSGSSSWLKLSKLALKVLQS